MALYNPLASPTSVASEPTQTSQPQPQQQEFVPEWDFQKTRDVIKSYDKSPFLFKEPDKEKIRQHANYHNVPFYEGEFDLMDSLQQAMGGFVEGFTTLSIVDPPDNEYESIIRNIAHLAGFAPGMLAAPAKLLGAGKASLGAIQALGKASVPMAAANFAQKKAKEIAKPVLKAALDRRGNASSTVGNFLLGNRARHVIEGAFHLGVASSVSAWQGGVDEMMSAFIGGAQAGGIFRGIGNMMGNDPGRGGQVLKALSGSLFQGLPATMRGATTPEQVYEYLLGAYFGGKEMPWTKARANKELVNMRKYAQENPEFGISMNPELLPQWKKIPSEVKPLLKKMARDTFGDPDERSAVNYFGAKLAQLEGRIENLPVEIEGFKATKEYREGETIYRLDKKDLKKWKNYGISGGDGEINKLFAQEGAKYNIPFIHYTTARGQKNIDQNTPGYKRPLSPTELSTANRAMTEANRSLNRSLVDMADSTVDLLRKNFFKVKNSDSIYIVGDLIKGNKEIAGGSGWVAQMGIDAAKRVNVYDQISKRWYEYAPSKDMFTEIANPKRPTRRFAAFGQGRLTSDGKKAIKDFYNQHFKPSKEAVKIRQNRFSEADEARLIEIQDEYQIIDRLRKEYNDGLLKEPKEGQPTKQELQRNLEDLEKREWRITMEEASIRQGEEQKFVDKYGKDLESEQRVNEDNDIGTRDDVKIGKRSIVYVNEHMESVWGTEATPVQAIRKAEIAEKVQDVVKPFIEVGSTRNRSNEAIEALKKEYPELKMTQEGKNSMRTWISRLNQDRDVQIVGADDKGNIKLLEKGNSVTQAGNRRNLKDPKKLIEEVAEAAGIKEGEVYAVIDHISMRPVDKLGNVGNWQDMDLRKIRDNLKLKFPKNPDKGLKEYHNLVTKYMNKMHDLKYYAFGGRGDADKIFFVKYHPKSDGSYLKEARKNKFFKGFYKYAELDFIKQYPMKDAKARFAKAFESNLLYDVSMNGLEFSTPKEFKQALEHINQDGFIGNSKAWNKRNQIWFTNSYKGDPASIAKEVNDLVDGNYSYRIIQDLPENIRELYKKDKKHGQYLNTPNNQTEEHRDGAILVRDDVIQAILKDAGQYTSKDYKKTGGQNKSFIVNPHETRGALLGKYMMHSAGEAETARMKKEGIHMEIMDTAAKQRGMRVYNEIYNDLNPENVRYNYSVKQDMHMTDPQKIPKQLLGALVENTWMPTERKLIEETFEELIQSKFTGSDIYNKKLDNYLQMVVEPGFSEAKKDIKLNELMSNLDKIGIHKLVNAMKMPNNDRMVNAIWRHILKVNTDMINEAQASGEEARVTRSMKELAEFDTVADNIITRMEEHVGQLKAKGVDIDSTIAYNHKYVNHYRQQAVRNWVVDVATKPKVYNSGVSRMRPYDIPMQKGAEDKYNKFLKELNNKDDIFFLDEAYRDKKLQTGIKEIGDISLGKLWDRYYAGRFENNPQLKEKVEEVFRSAVVRVPMDSMSGTQILNFRGFTNRPGFGILMHGRAMRALGGADLDGDEAFFYMGGRGGFKKELKDAFARNKEEFYKYTKGNKEIGHKEYVKLKPEEQKKWRGYVADSKQSTILKNVKDGKSGSSYSSLLANSPTKNQKMMMNSLAWKYSPSQRLRMSEFSTDGRGMIDIAVSNKQLMNFAYNSILANKNTPGKDEFETKFYDPVKKKDVRIKVTAYAKTDPIWQQQAREMGRAQVNLSADPMDEFGLKSKDLWFKSLYQSYFNLGSVKVYGGKTPTGQDKWVKSSNIKPEMLTMNHLKNGVFGNIINMNQAFYGRNWGANRKWNMGEISDMAADYMQLGLEQRNSMLPKIAEMLHPVDFSDSALQRSNIKAVKELYNEINDNIKQYDWLKNSKIISRTTFKVPRNIIIDKVLNNDLHTPDSFNRKTKFLDEFLDIVKGTHYAKFEGLIEKARDPEGGRDYRRRILRDMVDQANDFFINDLTDMVTVKRISDIAKTMTAEELKSISGIHKFVEQLKKDSYLRKRNLSKLNDFNLDIFTGAVSEKTKRFLKIAKEEGLNIEEPRPSRKIGSEATAELNQMQIDFKIKEFKEGKSKKQNEIFDALMIGSLNRANLVKLDKAIARIDKWDKTTNDLVREIYKEAARTSMSQLGFNSKEVAPQSLRNFMGEMSKTFEKSKVRITNEDAKEWVKLPLQNKKHIQEQWDNQRQKLADEKITGFEGLKEGPVSKEMKKVVSETIDILTFYGPKVKNSISELVRGIFQKDYNTMNKEDWRIFNDFLKTQRAGTLWQRLFDKKGEFKLSKRHHYMFPKAISREMLSQDMELLHERGYFMTPDARMIEGRIARPITYIDKVQGWIGKMNAQAEDTSEELINDLQKRTLFVNSFQDGEALRQIAVGRRNAREADRILNDSYEKMSDALKFQKAGEYQKVYKDLNKLHKYEESLANKEYFITIEGKGRKKYTGKEIVDLIDKTYTEVFEDAYKLVKGSPDAMKPFIVDYYDPKTKLSPKIDANKFIKHLEKTWSNGIDVTREFGIDGLRMVARQLQLDMLPKKMAKQLAYRPFEETGKIPFANYWPHMMFNSKKANRALVDAAQAVNSDPTLSKEARIKELTKLVHKHKNLTGDWGWADMAEWDMVDQVLENVANKKKTSEHILKWFNGDQRTGNLHRRTSHIAGWSIDSNVPEMYLKSITNSYFKNLSQIYSRGVIHDQMFNNKEFRKKFGDKQTDAWVKFMKLFANDAMGNHTVIPDAYRNDPNLKIKGTLYDWWSDDKVAARLTSMKKKIFGSDKVIELPEELKDYNVDLQQVRELSNLEAQFEMAALLAHPKSMVGNIFGGSAHTVQSVGWRNFLDGSSSKYLASINPEWAIKENVDKFVTSAGIMPEQMMYEFGLTKAANQVKNKQFIEAVSKKIFRDPEMAEETLSNLSKKYGVTDKVRNFAAKWMTIPERKLRRDAFMAHYVQWYKKLGGAVNQFDHPFIMQLAKKGVKATQFLYSAPYRPAFARTSLGKVMTRFQLWSWNAVRFRNDVLRQAKIYGFRPGTAEYDRFVRTTQIDMFVFALGNIFAYSLFDTGMPAPYGWFEDTAQWMFGDEKERDKAFYGTYPTAIAPLQVITPPIARIPTSIFSSMINDDYRRLSEYYVYTMFPFGRLARDFSPAVPGNLIETPTRVLEKWAGLPARDMQRAVQKWKKEDGKVDKPTPGGLYNPFK